MKVAIIGGGASGLVAAVSAARTAQKEAIKAEITVFEAKDRVGKKLLATGNGRCNMMNLNERVPYFGAGSFAENILKKFSVKSNLSFFASMGLYTRFDEEGRVYPMSNQASSVLDALRFECLRLGVKFETETEIKKIEKIQKVFLLNGKIKADKVVLACGSPALNKGFFGYELLNSLGHRITEVSPSLTKLTVKEKAFLKQLKGVRQKARLNLIIDRKLIAQENGEILFADYGLSGIAAMQISAYIARHLKKSKTEPIVLVDLVPSLDVDFLMSAISDFCAHSPSGKAENLLSGFMPKKIGEVILKSCGISLSAENRSLKRGDIEKIAYTAKNWTFHVEGLKDFSEAQVASGGAVCKEFNENTLESKIVEGLFCCGEVLDVDGLCGGYNLQWAWSSGRLCGESVIKGDKK